MSKRGIFEGLNLCRDCHEVLKNTTSTGILDGQLVIGTKWYCPKCGYYRFEGYEEVDK